MRVGLISDTHGLLRPEARAYLQKSDLIIHAGDICDEPVLNELALIAPTTAVRGNNDIGTWADRLRAIELVQAGEVLLCAIHDLSKLDRDPQKSGIRVVISGHTHKPLVACRGRVLFVNPGSAGPRRFRLPVSIGEIVIEGGVVSAGVTDLTTGMKIF
jgi:putative phosphoesterase